MSYLKTRFYNTKITLGELMRYIVFPQDFLFGAGICDYQHFGGAISDLPTIPAAKHALYFENDFKLLKKLGLNAFRTCIEWARIEPKEGKIDEDSVRFYHEYFSKLKSMGITTIVTLHHFTNPRWIHKYGGWLSEKILENFLKYVDFVTQEFDEYIDYYITINEPIVYVLLAYMAGETGFPPHHRNPKEARQCLRNINEAVQQAYEIIHEKCKKAKVGVAQACGILPLALRSWRGLLRWFLAKMSRSIVVDEQIEGWEGKYDFLGINYYSKSFLGKHKVYPEGLRKICKQLFNKYKKRILITENGLSNRDDKQRIAYLLLHLKSLYDAVTLDKVKVIGYCWWSFLHGYEWGLGYKPFFALIDVDVNKSYRRVLTKTAHIYSKIIKNSGFPVELYEEKGLSVKSLIKFQNWP
jgi:beta-glucosidase